MVIHGTDTMAFAASALSFMLENLQKPVILTGAQVTRPQSQRPPEAAGSGRGQSWASCSAAVPGTIPAVYCQSECVDTLGGGPACPLHYQFLKQETHGLPEVFSIKVFRVPEPSPLQLCHAGIFPSSFCWASCLLPSANTQDLAQ